MVSSISIFFPAYNDARTLPHLIQKAYRVARTIAKRYEVIIVNDGSTDETVQVLRSLKKRIPDLRIVRHPKNRGYGAALRSGFRAAKYDWVFYTDGDGQYDPSELTVLVRKLSPGIDVVNGYKIKRADPWIRTCIGKLYNWWAHRRTRLPIRDIDCDFRLIRHAVLDKVHLTGTSGTICLELITKLGLAGARFAETPIHHYPRMFGRSQFFRPRHLLATLREMFGV